MFGEMVMISHDVRMVELRNHPHFVNDGLLSVSVLTVQLLDGDLAMRDIFASKKHCAEAAFA